jgi:hypothetical protein
VGNATCNPFLNSTFSTGGPSLSLGCQPLEEE